MQTQLPAANLDNASSSHAIRVILVEDHDLVRGATKAILHSSGAIRVVGEADNASDALELVSATCPDVVVTDIRLKNSTGLALAAALEQAAPGTKTLALTAYPYEQYVRAMIKAGAEGYLLKEATGAELVQAITDVYEEKLVFASNAQPYLTSSRSGTPTGARGLTPRETEILELLDGALTVHDVAEHLKISPKTVYSYLARAHAKAASRAG